MSADEKEFEWRPEFQYLLDRKILSRSELAYLFGQIKSIIERTCQKKQEEIERLRKQLKELKEGRLFEYETQLNEANKRISELEKEVARLIVKAVDDLHIAAVKISELEKERDEYQSKEIGCKKVIEEFKKVNPKLERG